MVQGLIKCQFLKNVSINNQPRPRPGIFNFKMVLKMIDFTNGIIYKDSTLTWQQIRLLQRQFPGYWVWYQKTAQSGIDGHY